MTTIKDIANLFDAPLEAEHWLEKLVLPNGTIFWGRKGRAISADDLFSDLANRDGTEPYQVRTLATLINNQLHPKSDVPPGEPSQSHNYGVSSRLPSLNDYDRMDYGKASRRRPRY